MRIPIAGIIVFIACASASAEEIAGFGRTIEDAKLDARQHILESVLTKMEAQSPSRSSWRPTLADVEPWIQGAGRSGNATHVGQLGLVHQWILTVQLPSDGEIERRDNQAWRQRVAGIVVAAMISVCAVAAGAARWRRYAAS